MFHRVDDWRRRQLLLATVAVGVFAKTNAKCATLLGLPPSPQAVEAAWKTLPVGGGGLISGIRIAPDGRKIIRTDTHGEYVCDTVDPLWKQRLHAKSMPAGTFGYADNGNLIHTEGVIEVAIAPSNSNRLYKFYFGRVFRSDNFGLKWTETKFRPVTDNDNYGNNGDIKVFGPKIAVKPDDPDVIYVGTPADGLFFSDDGGNSWSVVDAAQIPKASNVQGYCIVFDKANVNHVWAGSYGNGWYQSTAAATGKGFSAIPGAPPTFRTAKSDQNGLLYVCVNGSNSLRRYNGSSWSNLSFNNRRGNEGRAQCVAINPRNANQVVVIIDSGHLSVSTDAGATWSGLNFGQHSLSNAGIRWLRHTAPGANQYMSATECDFCPVTGRLYLSAGVGIWWTTDLAGSLEWQQQSIGIEQLVTNQLMSRSDGVVLGAFWDRPVYRLDRRDFPSDWGPEHNTDINACWSLDCAPKNEDFVVALCNFFGKEHSARSEDGGRTWTEFGSFPPLSSNGFINGTIAVGSETNWVWVPCNGGGHPHFTTDGGQTWSIWDAPPSVPSSPADIGIGFAYFLNVKYLCKDWVSGLFYLYIHGTNRSHAYAGTYTSPTGETWTRVSTNRIPFGGANFRMDAVPGHEGHLFRTAGRSDGRIGGEFQRSTDGGANWSVVAGIVEVQAFGFGARTRNLTYPTLYAFGWHDRQPGIWRSEDADQGRPTWSRVGRDEFPLGSTDVITWVTGDKADPGRCYVGFRGSGAAQFA